MYALLAHRSALPVVTFRDLRHTGQTLAAQTDATLADLMKRLGHSSMAAARRYLHATAGYGGLLTCGNVGAWKSGGFRFDAGGDSASPSLRPALGGSFGADGPGSVGGRTGLADVTCRPGSAGSGAPGASEAPYRLGSGRSRRKQPRHQRPWSTTLHGLLPLPSTSTTERDGCMPLQVPLRCHFLIVGTRDRARWLDRGAEMVRLVLPPG